MTTFISQPDEAASFDAFIANGIYATTNYGNHVSLFIGDPNTAVTVYRTLIKFDLSTIPANAVVSSATIYLTITANYSSNARTHRIYRLLRNWSETQATWNIYATGLSWASPGGAGVGDIETPEIGSVVMSTTRTGEIAYPLDPAKVQEWISGAVPNYGVLIKADTEVDDRYTYASSSDTTPSKRPRMMIEYTVPGAPPATRVIWFD